MASREIVSFDWAIKNILRDKANYDVLEGFLFALLKEKITIEELIESESNQDSREMKFNRVDVLAINSKGEHIIIEVQYSPEQSYFKRLLYATAKDIVDNIKVGEDYSSVKKVYSVSLIYFDVNADPEDNGDRDYVYHGKVDFTGLHNGKKVAINPTYLVGYDSTKKDDINIFPEYFIIPLELFNGAVNDDLDEWIYAFKNHEVKDEFKATGIKELGEKLNFVSMNPEQQRQYKKYLEDLASDRAVLELNAKKSREQGIEQGIEQGEVLKARKVATRMKQDGLPFETIQKYTGLSIEDIEKL